MFELLRFSVELGVMGGVSFGVSSSEHFLPRLEVARSRGLANRAFFICGSLQSISALHIEKRLLG